MQGNKAALKQETNQPKLQEAQSKSASDGHESNDGAQTQQHVASEAANANGKTAEIRM